MCKVAMYIGVGEIGDSCVVTFYERLKICRSLYVFGICYLGRQE